MIKGEEMNNIPKKETHVLQVKMLGSFSMEYDQKPISFERQYFSKSIQLFLILILHKKEGIRKERLMEHLYGQAEGPNVNNNLNNMVCRLRKQLRELGLPKEDDIVIKSGQCRYVTDSLVKVDVQELEELLEKAGNKEIGPEERKGCLLGAIRRYGGELLPRLPGEAWVVVERTRCKRLYEAAMRQADQLLSREGSFEELYSLYAYAAKLYPLERWQEKQIECLMRMDQRDKAIQLYQKTAQMYMEQLGVLPTDTSLKCLREMEHKLFGYSKSLELIGQELKEHRKPGAYYCSFPSFLDSSRVMTRIMERTGRTTVLLMCTFEGTEAGNEVPGFTPPIQGKERTKWLCQSIQDSLRREDIYTRYSDFQYLALLTGAEPGRIDRIISRIDQRYQELSGSGRREIRYDVTTPVSKAPMPV